jgi:hypothetical protein
MVESSTWRESNLPVVNFDIYKELLSKDDAKKLNFDINAFVTDNINSNTQHSKLVVD